jgi:biopolymer transport protein TolR
MASAGGGTSGSSSRRRSLDAELNLVPFIDLLSTCICFLLMTAVWMEIGSLQVKQATGTDAPAANPQTMEMDLRFTSSSKMELAIKGANKKNQKFLVEAAKPEDRLAKLSEVLGGLPGILKFNPKVDFKAQFGQIFSVARVTTAAGVSYGDLVSVMDVLRDHGIVNLGVVPVRK